MDIEGSIDGRAWTWDAASVISSAMDINQRQCPRRLTVTRLPAEAVIRRSLFQPVPFLHLVGTPGCTESRDTAK
jgi:hypothetical protein